MGNTFGTDSSTVRNVCYAHELSVQEQFAGTIENSMLFEYCVRNCDLNSLPIYENANAISAACSGELELVSRDRFSINKGLEMLHKYINCHKYCLRECKKFLDANLDVLSQVVQKISNSDRNNLTAVAGPEIAVIAPNNTDHAVMNEFMDYVEKNSFPAFRSSIHCMSHTVDDHERALLSVDMSKYEIALRALLYKYIPLEISAQEERRITTVCDAAQMKVFNFVYAYNGSSTMTDAHDADAIRTLKTLISMEMGARTGLLGGRDSSASSKMSSRMVDMMSLVLMTTSFKSPARRVEAQNLMMGRMQGAYGRSPVPLDSPLTVSSTSDSGSVVDSIVEYDSEGTIMQQDQNESVSSVSSQKHSVSLMKLATAAVGASPDADADVSVTATPPAPSTPTPAPKPTTKVSRKRKVVPTEHSGKSPASATSLSPPTPATVSSRKSARRSGKTAEA